MLTKLCVMHYLPLKQNKEAKLVAASHLLPFAISNPKFYNNFRQHLLRMISPKKLLIQSRFFSHITSIDDVFIFLPS